MALGPDQDELPSLTTEGILRNTEILVLDCRSSHYEGSLLPCHRCERTKVTLMCVNLQSRPTLLDTCS